MKNTEKDEAKTIKTQYGEGVKEAYNEVYELLDEQRKIWSKIPSFGFLKNPDYADLSIADLRVLLFLLGRLRGGSRYGWSEATAFPLTSIQIAYGTALHKRTVDKALQRLKEHKLIDWVQTKSHGYVGPRKIFLHVDKIYETSKEDKNNFYSTDEIRELLGEPDEPRPPLVPRDGLARDENGKIDWSKEASNLYKEDVFGTEAEKHEQLLQNLDKKNKKYNGPF